MGTQLKLGPWGDDYPDEFFAPLNIFNALDDGDWKAVGDFFTNNPSFLDYYYCGKSLLHIFAEYDYPELLETALRLGINVNVEKEGYTSGALTVAVDRGKFRSARCLLEHGAHTRYEFRGLIFSCGALSAVAAGEFEMVKLLVEHGAPVDILVDDPPRGLLSMAINCRHTEMADYLRSKGALTDEEIKARDAKGKPKRKK
jgi:hypothetical protein